MKPELPPTWTVGGLIEELQQIRDKDTPVFIQSVGYQHHYDFEVEEASNELESVVFLRVMAGSHE